MGNTNKRKSDNANSQITRGWIFDLYLLTELCMSGTV